MTNPSTRTLRRERTRKTGYSLVELLVAIGIVITLASLLYPNLRGGVDKAQSATALSNLRSLGMSILSYAGDHDGLIIPVYFYPAGQTSGGADRAWIHELVQQGYMQDGITHQNGSGQWENTHQYSKMFNPITRNKYPNVPVAGGFGLNIFYDSFAGFPLQRIARPAQMILAADASFKNQWFDWGLGDVNGVAVYPNTLSGGVAHYLFCDGHTEKIKAANPNATDSLPEGYNQKVFLVPGEQQ